MGGVGEGEIDVEEKKAAGVRSSFRSNYKH